MLAAGAVMRNAGEFGILIPYLNLLGLPAMHVLFGGILDAALSGGIIGGVVGGVSAGLGVLLFAFLIPRKKCPDCQTLLPRFRRPANRQQALWGGATCPECGCEVDRQGRKIKNNRNADA